MKEALHGSKGLVVLIVLLLVFPTIARQSFSTRLQDSPEYRRHVHNHLRFGGGVNATYVEKPVFPVLMNESQIPIGQNWSIVCPLRANHGYHVYCYGEWVNNGSEPKTDYDIYVYNPLGEMEGYHTESAGLPEHLGTTVNEPFFKPRLSGNYTFVVRNDPRESKHAQKATFMMIENVKCNAWHEHYVEGKDASSSPVFNTSWAYEFWTESQHVEIWIKVPESLDMYEARVYLMGNPLSKMGQILNEVPLAWEPGLYGNSSNKCGGYNLESKEDRGLAYTSCEFFGQDMFLNFTSPYRGKSLYHLVLIGETGSGTVEFLVKTEFDKACLRPSTIPSRVYPHNGTAITYFSNSTDLTNATLQYSIDGWQNTTTLRMDIVNNRTCWATIPEQNAGTVVSYVVEAKDIFENLLKAGGSFPVKHQLTLTISLPRKAVTIGENMTVRGYVTPAGDELPIVLTFTSTNQSKQIECSTFENGTFIASFRPETLGAWSIQATFGEDRFRYGSTSAQLVARVDEPSLIAKYSLYIGGGLGTLAVVSAIVYVKKKTE